MCFSYHHLVYYEYFSFLDVRFKAAVVINLMWHRFQANETVDNFPQEYFELSVIEGFWKLMESITV